MASHEVKTRADLLRLIDRAADEGWTELDLAGLGLEELPGEIGKLGQLETLILGKWDREREGPIEGYEFIEGELRPSVISNRLKKLPRELAQLKKLKVLKLSGNSFQSLEVLSEIPILQELELVQVELEERLEIPIQFQFLQYLNLSSTQISQLPEEIIQLQSLQDLDLSNTQIRKLPKVIGQLKSLQKLDLHSTQISQLPEEIGQLKSLQTLILRSTQTRRLPQTIIQLKSLQSLDLESTLISQLPEKIGQLKSLKFLNLSNTKIRHLPEEIGQLKSLREINLRLTQISQIPEKIGQLKSLKSLNLNNTQISQLPEEIGQLKSLQKLNLRSTQIRQFPKEILLLKSLQKLNLRSTQVRWIPETVSQLQSLQVLNLISSQVSQLPESISQLQSLQTLDLSNTQISQLPEVIGQLRSLKILNLRSTQISQLPKEIGQLRSLQTLNLVSSKISSLPKEIGQLQSLQNLNLSNTQISQIPKEIEQLKYLQNLDLSDTKINHVPKEIGKLKYLQNLDLRNTKISQIPKEIEQLRALKNLDLSSTKVSQIPKEIEQLQSLKILNLDSTYICHLPKEIGQLKSLQSLYLRSTKISQIPEEIGQLKSLQSLYLSNTQINQIPEKIEQLHSLQVLNLDSTQISQLPKAVGQLHALQVLNLDSTQISQLPKAVGQLKSLQTLDLDSTQISELPEEIGQLKSLQILNLDSTQISELPEKIGQLKSLQNLYLRSTQISQLPKTVGQLKSLQNLSLGSTQIIQIPKVIGQLKSLKSLDLSNTKINQIFEDIGRLKSLQNLNLSNTQISEIPKEIGQLESLQILDLSNTQTSELPKEIGQLKSLQTLSICSSRISSLPNWLKSCNQSFRINLYGNPIAIPCEFLEPEEIFESGVEVQKICNFYFQIQNLNESKPLQEAKLLIIGEGGAGKTTLTKKLNNPSYELKLENSKNPEKSTEGIEINRWDFDHRSDSPFRVNVWDFGGQEVYHATHQFFLTKRSVYALVIDNRRENPNLYYWLNIVRLLGGDSPIFIVKNEKQNRQCEINEGQLRAEFNNLEKSVCVNFNDNRGLNDLKTTIQRHITVLPEIDKPWPNSWVCIRHALENDSANYIDLTEYLDLCRTNGISSKSEALQISSLLHELGICLHFQTDLGLKNCVILSPTWATNAVYKVTDSQKVKEDLGRFSREELDEIWSDSEYTDVQDELLALMQKFAICYPLRGEREGSFIAPSLLSIDRPDYDWEETNNLILRYDYEFMPKGLITRLIVEMHELIEPDDNVQGLVWKSGVVLSHGNARAEVIENYNKSELSIRVTGAQQKTLLDWIRREIYKIHSTYPNIEVEELIPCNCKECDGNPKPYLYKLSDLERRVTNKRYEVECEKSYTMVNVQRLISNITNADRMEPGISPRVSATKPGSEGFSPSVSINIQQQSQDQRNMATFNQKNYGNAKGFQAEAGEGATLYQAETINIYNNNQTQILQLVANLRQIASTFPQDLQDDLTIDIDDVEEELKKPEDKRNPNKLKKRLLALAMAFSAIAAPTAAMADFTNNVTDLAEKAGIELQLPGQ